MRLQHTLRERDDRNATATAPIGFDAVLKPQAQRRFWLVSQPKPSRLDHRGAQSRVSPHWLEPDNSLARHQPLDTVDVLNALFYHRLALARNPAAVFLLGVAQPPSRIREVLCA